MKIFGRDKTINIGLYTPSYPGITREGGIGTYTRHLARALVDLGHQVHVLTPGSPGPPIRDGNVTVHVVRADYFPLLDRLLPGVGAGFRISAAMRQLVARYRLHIVEFANWEGQGACFCLRRPTPVVVRLSTSSAETQVIDGIPASRVSRWDVRWERWLSLQADVLVTSTHAHRCLMAEELGISNKRIRIIPLGIPVFPEFRRPLPQGDRPTVVYVGRLEKRKGTLDLLQAIPAVLQEVPQTKFLLIGNDRPHCPGGRTHREYLRDEFPPEIQTHIELLGRLPDQEVDHWLQRADLFVAPSIYESFGLVFPEAMRWGTPVIGTRVGGIPDIVQHEATGLLVSTQSPQELAQAIIGLLKNEQRRRHLGESARRHVESAFSISLMAQRTVELYRQTIDQWEGKHSNRRQKVSVTPLDGPDAVSIPGTIGDD